MSAAIPSGVGFLGGKRAFSQYVAFYMTFALQELFLVLYVSFQPD